MTRLLAVSGSLRARSSNTAVLQAAMQLAPVGVKITMFAGLVDLPYFNPITIPIIRPRPCRSSATR